MPDHPFDRTNREQAVRRFVHHMLRCLLKLGPEAETARQSPAALGLSSLAAIALQYQLQADHGVDVTVREIMEAPSPAGLADLAAARLSREPSDTLPSPGGGVLI